MCECFQHSPVFRIGGDEFVITLTGHDYEKRNDLITAFNRRVEENLGTDRVVISAGISDYHPSSDYTAHDVFERADAKMYERKKELKSMGARSR